MTNKNFESISALLDDEVKASELQSVVGEIETEQKEAFSRYSLIGDVMRNEQELVSDSSFADSIQAAIANIELDSVEQKADDTLVSIASHPKWHQRVKQKLTQFGQSSTGRGMSQMAIAASVALVAVVGVSNMTPQQDDSMPTPVISTVPLVDGLSPVSTDGLKAKPSADQVTQSRINALMADHNQQLRAADDKEDEDEEKDNIDN
mgnify:CR=1 FL=1